MRNPEKGPGEESKNFYLEKRDIYKENATELQNNMAEIQEAKLGVAIRQLMKRTEDNPELVNKLNAFLDALMHQAELGDSEKPIGKAALEELIDYFGEKTEELRWDVGYGGRRADRKPTWEKKNK